MSKVFGLSIEKGLRLSLDSLRPFYWKEIGDRAAGAVEEIYEDLRKNEKRIQKIEASARTALAKQVRALYDVSRMAGTSCSHSGECKS